MGIVCPYCDAVDRNPFDNMLEPNEEELICCEECGKEFYAIMSIEVSFSARKAVYGNCKNCGKTDVVVSSYRGYMGGYNDFCETCGNITRRKLELKFLEEVD